MIVDKMPLNEMMISLKTAAIMLEDKMPVYKMPVDEMLVDKMPVNEMILSLIITAVIML
jgi:hypothetical protein